MSEKMRPILNEDELEGVVGGASNGTQSKFRCPIVSKEVIVTEYAAGFCNCSNQTICYRRNELSETLYFSEAVDGFFKTGGI